MGELCLAVYCFTFALGAAASILDILLKVRGLLGSAASASMPVEPETSPPIDFASDHVGKMADEDSAFAFAFRDYFHMQELLG